MDGMFHRTKLLIGDGAFEVLRGAHVAVFGLGGVGSYAVEGLARAGVGRLTLVDFDEVGPTNINRQCFATVQSVGKPKVDMALKRVAQINPACRATSIMQFYDVGDEKGILSEDFDLVIDAIDSFNSKIDLLVRCTNMGIPVLSAMGAGGKVDPSQVRVGDISQTTICPLARRIRKHLRYHGISEGISVVYSIEPAVLPYSHKEVAQEHKDAKEGFERMIMGTISYIPAIFGFTLSGLAIRHLTGIETARQSPLARFKRT